MKRKLIEEVYFALCVRIIYKHTTLGFLKNLYSQIRIKGMQYFPHINLNIENFEIYLGNPQENLRL